MCQILSFADAKAGKIFPTSNVDPPKKDLQKIAKEQYVRHNKVVSFITHINSLYRHKFTYPILAAQYPKGTHSLDVLCGHCFNAWGGIQSNAKSQPGIALAKRWAYERR